MSEPIDANTGSAPSALQTAFDNNSDSQGAATQTPAPTPQSEPSQSSAGTLKTEVDGQPEEQLPFHSHPRWQKMLKERKDMEQQVEQAKHMSEYGNTWYNALANHPEFAQEVMGIIQKMTQVQKAEEAGVPQDQIDPVIKQLKDEIKELKQAYSEGSEFIRKDKFEKTKSKYQSDFQKLIGDFHVPEEYQEIFEERVWRHLQKLNPQAVANLEYDPEAFSKAVEMEKDQIKRLTNKIVSSYTTDKLKQAVPKTQSGGITTLTVPQASDEEVLSDFVGQINSLRGA